MSLTPSGTVLLVFRDAADALVCSVVDRRDVPSIIVPICSKCAEVLGKRGNALSQVRRTATVYPKPNPQVQILNTPAVRESPGSALELRGKQGRKNHSQVRTPEVEPFRCWSLSLDALCLLVPQRQG